MIAGAGHTTIGDREYHWEQGDTFCIPSWYPFQHFAHGEAGADAVYLYRFDDKPMLTALGFYRTADTDIETLVSE